MAQTRCFQSGLGIDYLFASAVQRCSTRPPLPPLAKGGSAVWLRDGRILHRGQIAVAVLLRSVFATGLIAVLFAAHPAAARGQASNGQTGKLTVRVVDAASGKILPARLVLKT